MSKAEKTRNFILEKTATLFNSKGYISTSLSDITEATGLSKGSIYGNFDSRNDLALEAFKYNSGQLRSHLSQTVDDITGCKTQLIAFLDFYRANWQVVFQKGGCPLMNAATESDDTFPELKNLVIGSFENLILKVKDIIKKGQKSGEFNDKIDAESYASLFIIIIEGGILLSKTTGKKEHLNLALERILDIINNELITKLL